jgi:tRNA-specific 2-thiouridylase
VGQRKGLGIGGLEAPLYVVALDVERNRVIVGPREALRASEVSAFDVRWRGPRDVAIRVMAAVRYRMPAQAALATFDGDELRVVFDEGLDGVAPGQSIVCYEDDRVIGGGVIACAS